MVLLSQAARFTDVLLAGTIEAFPHLRLSKTLPMLQHVGVPIAVRAVAVHRFERRGRVYRA